MTEPKAGENDMIMGFVVDSHHPLRGQIPPNPGEDGAAQVANGGQISGHIRPLMMKGDGIHFPGD